MEEQRLLKVEDGNHGEYRPRPDEFVEEGVPFVRAADLQDGRIRFEKTSRINETAVARVRKGVGKPGDSLVSHKGTVGKVAFAPLDCEGFICSPQTTFWRVLDERAFDRRWLFYFLQSRFLQDQLKSMKGETDMADYVSLTSQRTLKVWKPPVSVQRSIVRVLGALDDKIELNRQMNETLEGIARAIFKSWFVDFDPVRAKTEDRQVPGMDAAAALFPDSLINTELGPIPEGWDVVPLEDQFDYQMGQSPPGATYNEIGEGVPLYQGKAEFGFRFPTRRLFCNAPTRLAKPGDTLVSVRAPVGAMNMSKEACCIGRGLAAVRHRSGSRAFTYYAMDVLADVFSTFEGEGTVFGSINRKALGLIPTVKAPDKVVQKFDELLSPLDAQIELLEDQERTLSGLRDALLPKLISGEIRIKDAEKVAETATESRREDVRRGRGSGMDD